MIPSAQRRFRLARLAAWLPCAMLGLAPAPSPAHDAWLEPERFRLARGETLVVRQRFGHALQVETELALDRSLTSRFELVTDGDRVDLLAAAPARHHLFLTPVLERAVDFEGAALLGMEHGYLAFTSSDSAFRAHLEREGLLRALRALERLPPATKRRERYARSLKALVHAGGGEGSALSAQSLGHVFEILLLDDPADARAGDTLRVRLLLAGRPLSHHPIHGYAGSAERPLHVEAATDGWGDARLALPVAGPWLVRATRTASCAACPEAEWESHWASFRFQVPAE